MWRCIFLNAECSTSFFLKIFETDKPFIKKANEIIYVNASKISHVHGNVSNACLCKLAGVNKSTIIAAKFLDLLYKKFKGYLWLLKNINVWCISELFLWFPYFTNQKNGLSRQLVRSSITEMIVLFKMSKRQEAKLSFHIEWLCMTCWESCGKLWKHLLNKLFFLTVLTSATTISFLWAVILSHKFCIG